MTITRYGNRVLGSSSYKPFITATKSGAVKCNHYYKHLLETCTQLPLTSFSSVSNLFLASVSSARLRLAGPSSWEDLPGFPIDGIAALTADTGLTADKDPLGTDIARASCPLPLVDVELVELAVRDKPLGSEAESVMTLDDDGDDCVNDAAAVSGATLSTGFPVAGSIEATGEAVVE